MPTVSTSAIGGNRHSRADSGPKQARCGDFAFGAEPFREHVRHKPREGSDERNRQHNHRCVPQRRTEVPPCDRLESLLTDEGTRR